MWRWQGANAGRELTGQRRMAREQPTLNSLELGTSKSHGQVKRDVVLVVTHRHEEVKLHLGQDLSVNKQLQYYKTRSNKQDVLFSILKIKKDERISINISIKCCVDLNQLVKCAEALI